MKILIITNLFPNSIESTRGMFNFQQFKALASLPSVEIKVIAPVPWFPRLKIKKEWYSFSLIPKKETISGFEVYHPRYVVIPKILRLLDGFAFFLGIMRTVKEVQKKFSFECILVTWAYPDGFGSFLAAKVLKKPVIIKVHGSDINVHTKSMLRKKMISYALRNSDKVIAVSSALKDRMVRICVPSEKIVVIPNGVNTGLFKPMDQTECRRKLELSLDKKIVLFVGNLVKIKGVETLVNAFAGLRVSGLLVLVGNGPLEGTLRAKVKELGMEDRVIFAGRKAHGEIRYYMNACDIFCLPSRNEGCPNVLIEAVSCGKYVVATRVGGIPEIIESDRTGIMVEPDRPTQLAEAINKSLEISRIPGRTSSERRSYTWKQSAEMLSEVLNNLPSEKIDRTGGFEFATVEEMLK